MQTVEVSKRIFVLLGTWNLLLILGCCYYQLMSFENLFSSVLIVDKKRKMNNHGSFLSAVQKKDAAT